MAFVSEKLEGKDLEYVKSFGFKHPLSIKDDAILPSKWVADHENNCYFICLGAGGGRSYETDEFPPSYYKLLVNNKVIDVEARYHMQGNGKIGIKMWWKIVRIVVFDGFDIKTEKIKEILMQTIKLDSNLWRENHVIEVNFDSIAEPIFVKEGDK